MTHGLRDRLIPPAQRRSLDELAGDLHLDHGDTASKQSAFWTLLFLSGVIATAGVLADSVATVIGAMIIAPLSQPIMSLALGVIERRRTKALLFVVSGVALVVAIGWVASLVLPTSFDIEHNDQIMGRTSPGLLDLVAAVATGTAGAVALARRDIAAVLPGVAISISLVPPLAVAGVCLGEGHTALALGALLLFLSNLVALVLAGTVVFSFCGYAVEGREAAVREGRTKYGTMRRPAAVLAISVTMVSIPLVLNTAITVYMANLSLDARAVADEWIAAVPDSEVTDVSWRHLELHVEVRTPDEVPDTADLVSRLADVIPFGVPVVVDTSLGERIDAGTVSG